MCDELDGRAARAFNQTSTLGALLDMVTDRVATTGLLAILCAVYPAGSLVFLVLLALDISSHWFQMYSTLLAGSATHKVRGGDRGTFGEGRSGRSGRSSRSGRSGRGGCGRGGRGRGRA